MDDQHWERADALLVAALEQPRQDRDAFVEQAAAGDTELIALVHRLLRHAEDSDEELIPGLRLSLSPGQGILPAEVVPAVSPPGTVLGHYRLLAELGRGGMAVVYRAERADGDFEQQVALKQILGPNSEGLAQRLERERQILARATHPDMARLLDGGLDADGRPYLVMELVDGVPIDEYCDRERLTVPRRLELFLRIARAVQYAHRNLVVHRDIKPSNILVTDEGHPKLLDFGIARLLDGPESQVTRHGPQPMTPAYASPEQVRGEPVTTLSDVYQLGLLLYLLLTGRGPYRHENSSTPLEVARVISEQPATLPHKVLAEPATEDPDRDVTVTVEQIAHQRRTSAAALVRRLRGDLGFIVLMALRKEPDRRYASVELMSKDIERHLAGHTVSARPDSFWYRSRTFCRRHGIAVAFAGLLLAALVTFSAVTTVQSRRLASERDRANREVELTAEVSGFLTDLFRVSDPSAARGDTVTAREILDRGSLEIDQRMPEPTLVRARLKRTMGEVYENLGLYPEALALYEGSLATAIQVDGDNSPEAWDTRSALARLYLRLARYEESEALTRSLLTMRRGLLGEEHPRTLESTSRLASLEFYKGNREEAEALYRQILEVRHRVQGPDHPDTLGVAANLATTLFSGGRLEEAETFYQQVFKGLERSLGGDHPKTLQVASNLASVRIQLKRFDEAEPLLISTLERRQKVLGIDHPDTLTTESNLAGLRADRGDHAEAEKLYRRVYEGRQSTVGVDHPSTFVALGDLAWLVSLDPARHREAVDLYRETLAGYEQIAGAEHRSVLRTLYTLAVLEAAGGRGEKALAYLKKAVDRGFAGRKLFDEPAFATLGDHPEMRALQAEVQGRLDAVEP